jgi:hypothetical protein
MYEEFEGSPDSNFSPDSQFSSSSSSRSSPKSNSKNSKSSSRKKADAKAAEIKAAEAKAAQEKAEAKAAQEKAAQEKAEAKAAQEKAEAKAAQEKAEAKAAQEKAEAKAAQVKAEAKAAIDAAEAKTAKAAAEAAELKEKNEKLVAEAEILKVETDTAVKLKAQDAVAEITSPTSAYETPISIQPLQKQNAPLSESAARVNVASESSAEKLKADLKLGVKLQFVLKSNPAELLDGILVNGDDKSIYVCAWSDTTFDKNPKEPYRVTQYKLKDISLRSQEIRVDDEEIPIETNYRCYHFYREPPERMTPAVFVMDGQPPTDRDELLKKRYDRGENLSGILIQNVREHCHVWIQHMVDSKFGAVYKYPKQQTSKWTGVSKSYVYPLSETVEVKEVVEVDPKSKLLPINVAQKMFTLPNTTEAVVADYTFPDDTTVQNGTYEILVTPEGAVFFGNRLNVDAKKFYQNHPLLTGGIVVVTIGIAYLAVKKWKPDWLGIKVPVVKQDEPAKEAEKAPTALDVDERITEKTMEIRERAAAELKKVDKAAAERKAKTEKDKKEKKDAEKNLSETDRKRKEEAVIEAAALKAKKEEEETQKKAVARQASERAAAAIQAETDPIKRKGLELAKATADQKEILRQATVSQANAEENFQLASKEHKEKQTIVANGPKTAAELKEQGQKETDEMLARLEKEKNDQLEDLDKKAAIQLKAETEIEELRRNQAQLLAEVPNQDAVRAAISVAEKDLETEEANLKIAERELQEAQVELTAAQAANEKGLALKTKIRDEYKRLPTGEEKKEYVLAASRLTTAEVAVYKKEQLEMAARIAKTTAASKVIMLKRKIKGGSRKKRKTRRKSRRKF